MVDSSNIAGARRVVNQAVFEALAKGAVDRVLGTLGYKGELDAAAPCRKRQPLVRPWGVYSRCFGGRLGRYPRGSSRRKSRSWARLAKRKSAQVLNEVSPVGVCLIFED